MTQKTALIDADILTYMFGFAHEETYDFDGDGDPAAVADYEAAAEHIDNEVLYYQDQTGADDVVVALSDKDHPNWREAFLSSYKANRSDSRPPLLYWDLRQYIIDTYPTYIRPALEADDVLGILSTSTKAIPGKKCIVSTDKDFWTIPGWLWDPRNHKDQKPVKVSRPDADYWHLYQTLTGDQIDNYKGCPGIGPKKAEKLLMEHWDPEEMNVAEAWEVIVAAFKKKGLTEDDALVQARVARICRKEDFDFKNKQVIPWTPPENED
mgnify:CR=1 FL=1